MEDRTYPSATTDEDYRYGEGATSTAVHEYPTNPSMNEIDEEQNYVEYLEGEDHLLNYPIGDGQDIDGHGGGVGGGDIPIGGGSGGAIRNSNGIPYLQGEYGNLIDDDYLDYRVSRNYNQPRTVKADLMVNQGKYLPTYPIPRRGQIIPQRSSNYYNNEFGDYRRTNLINKLNFVKREYDSGGGGYPVGLDPSYSKFKRDSILRNLNEKEYRAKMQQRLQEQRLIRQERLAAGYSSGAAVVSSSGGVGGGGGGTGSVQSSKHFYQQELSHDQLQEAFMKNYNIDARKPTQKPSKVHSFAFQAARNNHPRISMSPRSDTLAYREYYRAAHKRLLSRQQMEKNDTKDTKSEPNQHFEEDLKYSMKLPRPRSPNIVKNQRAAGGSGGGGGGGGGNGVGSSNKSTPESYPKSINYDAMMKAAQKNAETDLEVKYKNEDFEKRLQDDTDTGGGGNGTGVRGGVGKSSDIRYPVDSINVQSSTTSLSQLKEDTSDEKMLTPLKDSTKMKNSARSNRSKRSTHSGRSKRYSDIVKLQKSKCTVMSVIYDGIQRCEQAKYEFNPSAKYAAGKSSGADSQALKPSKHSQTVQLSRIQDSSMASAAAAADIMNSELIANMFKEFRDYHLQNISQEVKRLQYLDVLPQKIAHLHGT